MSAHSEQPPPAFYALTGGGWRDWWALLHPPYTVWHLSYVALGASTATAIRWDHLAATLLAFFLAVGLGAHALDELNGRPLRTAIATRVLQVVAVISIAGAVVLGVFGVGRVGAGLLLFIVFGAFIVAAYNLEWFGGAFHTDLWFAAAWGAFPALTGAFAQTGTLDAAALLVAAACLMASVAQRSLSTPVRALRRRTAHIEGRIERTDGSTEPITRTALLEGPERALRALSVAVPLLALGAVLTRAV